MSRYRWILDAGHGGVAFGSYMTAGKRSPSVPPGIFEGEFNRDVCSRIAAFCEAYRIDAIELTPGPIAVPLAARVAAVNKLQRRFKNCILVSVHANASAVAGWCKAGGVGAMYADKQSAPLATLFSEHIALETGLANRGAKNKNFSILSTACRSILTENGFMTNKVEAEYLASERGRGEVALGHFAAIQEVENGKY